MALNGEKCRLVTRLLTSSDFWDTKLCNPVNRSYGITSQKSEHFIATNGRISNLTQVADWLMYKPSRTCPPVHVNNVQLPPRWWCQVSWATPWQETYLAQTHFRKTETTRNHAHQNVLVTQTKVKTLYKQQTSHIYKTILKQSGLKEYNSGVRLPLPT
jgi:hypothetical protein